MRTNPGGMLDIRTILGRDSFIAKLWDSLDRQSIRLEAERRIGKTSILRKMVEEPPEGWEAIYLDLEACHSPDEFAERVCHEVDKRLSFWNRTGSRIKDFVVALRDRKLLQRPHERPPGYWKQLLRASIEDLMEQQQTVNKRVVFFFDEIPWMISSIAGKGDEGPNRAMEVLDLLRSLRMTEPTGTGFRMILCGSIGMHHILSELEAKGYRNRPVNDMKLVECPPLAPADAAQLTTQLMDGEGLRSDADVPAHIAKRTGGFPYYIHWIVDSSKKQNSMLTCSAVDQIVRELFAAGHDPCDFRHFNQRIEKYYPGQEKFARALLDTGAAAKQSLPQQELIKIAKSIGPIDDDQVRRVLTELVQDHYLIRDAEARYAFRHVMLRDWWCLERGLN